MHRLDAIAEQQARARVLLLLQGLEQQARAIELRNKRQSRRRGVASDPAIRAEGPIYPLLGDDEYDLFQ